MNNQYPAASRVTGSTANSPRVGDLPPLPREPLPAARHPQTDGFVAPEAVSLRDRLQDSLDLMADDVFEKDIIGLRMSINAAQARFAVEVRELERRGVPELDHGLTTTGWLKKFCQMSPAEASGTTKTARAMAHMPTVTSGALAGEVPARSTQLLGQARDRYPSEFEDHELVFAAVASYLSVTDLRKVINHWEQPVN